MLLRRTCGEISTGVPNYFYPKKSYSASKTFAVVLQDGGPGAVRLILVIVFNGQIRC